jgi:hypothetical protein
MCGRADLLSGVHIWAHNVTVFIQGESSRPGILLQGSFSWMITLDASQITASREPLPYQPIKYMSCWDHSPEHPIENCLQCSLEPWSALSYRAPQHSKGIVTCLLGATTPYPLAHVVRTEMPMCICSITSAVNRHARETLNCKDDIVKHGTSSN